MKEVNCKVCRRVKKSTIKSRVRLMEVQEVMES